ncbi:MAG: hypothetical protein RBU35_23700 [Anaerolineae bacterium]|jgi:hypothetical protein|nr:hypothetical protein [Anaerolineae bacterium]
MSNVPYLQARKAPGPGRPFVNRKVEIDHVRSKLKTGIAGEPMPLVVTCFWGAYGMGKSWLLLRLQDLYKGHALEDPGPCPVIVARLDLDRERSASLWHENELQRGKLIQELWMQLAQQMGEAVPDLGRASDEHWAEAFVQQVTEWAASAVTPLIMLDTLDALVGQNDTSFYWLEEHLVERLAITDRVLFVFAGRGELRRWERFQVRRRVNLHRLFSFREQEVGEELGASRPWSRILYQHAFGHPLTAELLGTQLEKQGIDLGAEDASIDKVEPGLAGEVLAHVVEEALESLEESLHPLARPASLLRWLNVEPLRALVEALGLGQADRGDAYYMRIIEALQAQHLLYWHTNKKGYQPDPVLRALVSAYLERAQPELFLAVHRAALSFHDGRLEKQPSYLSTFLPEIMYHYVQLYRREPAGERPAFGDWWAQFLRQDSGPRDATSWQELVEALENDQELMALAPRESKMVISEAETRAHQR